MRFSDSVDYIGSEVLPKSSRFELHMLFQYLGMGHDRAAEDAQFHRQVLQTSSKKDNEEGMGAS